MIKDGMFIQERYEIVGKIGAGGMADVYKAKDHKLNRFVAVKVLKQEFKEDTAFVSKFRVEAQSAAGLSHPNIVNVYDVGDDNGIYFIVMELVEGITLKDYIGKKGKLAVREATSIAVQVSLGLQAAHQKGIVHRDIKPQNIIISTDGKVKVTDFGIARAVSSNTISSNAMGSVHYSSPEQARGGYSDFKSDIYSLGITMFEMVTGRVPFEGESTVAIAIKHLQEEMPSPLKFVSDLPKSTVQIICKCTQKSPDRRYGDTAELIQDLKESLVNPDGDFVQLAALNNTAQTVVISKDEMDQIHNGYGQAGEGQNEGQNPEYGYNGAYPQGGYPGGGNGYPGNYPGNGYPGNGYPNQNFDNPGYPNQEYQDPNYQEDEEEDDSGINPKLEKVMTVGSIIIAVVIGCIFLALIANALGFKIGGGKKKEETETTKVTEAVTNTTKETTAQTNEDDKNAADAQVLVPDLRGLTEAEAKSRLNELGLGAYYAGEQSSSEYYAGQIVSQNPSAETYVDKNTTISYTVSKGAEAQQGETVSVPELSGMTEDEVRNALTNLNLNVSFTTQESDLIASNLVISSSPKSGTEVKTGDTVIVVMSTGPKDHPEESETTSSESGGQVTVPSVIGSSLSDAKSTLEALGFVVSSAEEVSKVYSAGTIMEQNLQSGTQVDKGSSITITVSAGEGDPEETNSASGSWTCNVGLKAPDNYNGQAVKIILTQNDVSTVVTEGTPITFPYQLNVQGQAGVATGVAYIYVQDTNTGEYTNPIRYDNIPFKQGS